MKCACETTRTRGKRCGNDAETVIELDGRRWDVCTLHAELAAQGKTVRIHPDAESREMRELLTPSPELRAANEALARRTGLPILTLTPEAYGEPADSRPDGPDTPDGPDAAASSADEPDDPATARILAEFPADPGPEREPLAQAEDVPRDAGELADAAREILGELPELDPETGDLPPEPEPARGAPPAPAPSRGPWTGRTVREFVDAVVVPIYRRAGVATPEPEPLDWWAAKVADCMNQVASRIDPNNPWGALVLSTLIVWGPPTVQLGRARRRAARAPQPAGRGAARPTDADAGDWFEAIATDTEASS